MAEGFDYAIAQGHYIDAGNAARRFGQPGYSHQDGLAAVFEAGRQSVLQGGVVVPRELLESLRFYASWSIATPLSELFETVKAADALLAGTPDIQGNDRKPEPPSPEFKYQAESLNAVSFGTPDQDGQK